MEITNNIESANNNHENKHVNGFEIHARNGKHDTNGKKNGKGVCSNGVSNVENYEDGLMEEGFQPPPPIPQKGTPDFWRLETVEEAAMFIRSRLPVSTPTPEVGVVCGSGCGAIADTLTNATIIPFEDIPHFLPASVDGHKGLLHVGTLSGKSVILLQGRFHAYEGYHYGQAAFPIRVMKMLGASMVIITLATGGLNPNYQIGDLMIVKDHVSFPMMTGSNPLKGPNDHRLGPRFVAQNNAYDRDLRSLAKKVSETLDFQSFVREGNYVQISGPNYETPMECRFLRMIGADAVGMSNAHECLVARHVNMKVLSIALITNKCIMDVDDEKYVNHEEVLETGKSRADDLKTLVAGIIHAIGR